MLVNIMTAAVAAAASVPSILTSAKDLYLTLDRNKPHVEDSSEQLALSGSKASHNQPAQDLLHVIFPLQFRQRRKKPASFSSASAALQILVSDLLYHFQSNMFIQKRDGYVQLAAREAIES